MADDTTTATTGSTTRDVLFSSSKSSGEYDGSANIATNGTTTTASSRGRQTFKFKVRFDSQKMLFDTRYPEELTPVLPREEWDGILRHLNTDLNQSVQSSISNLHSWTTGMLASCALIVGVFIVPVVWVKTAKHERLMQTFWQDVRDFFTEINRRTFIRRGLEWKIVEDRRRMRRRDCYNQMYLYRVELMWRKNVAKSKKELARLGASLGGGSQSAIGSSVGRSISRRKSRPPSNIESVQEVPSDREGMEEATTQSTAIQNQVEEESDVMKIDDGKPDDSGLIADEQVDHNIAAVIQQQKDPNILEAEAEPKADISNDNNGKVLLLLSDSE